MEGRTTAPDHDALWSATQGGDEAAAAELMRLLEGEARRILSARRVRGADAEDVVAEAALSTLRFVNGGNPAPTNLRVFLQWRCRSVLKKLVAAHSRQAFALGEDWDLAGDSTLEPTTAFERKHLETALSACVEGLDQKAQQLYELRFVKGRTQRHIASSSGQSESAVCRGVARVIEVLRGCLEAKGYGAS